MQYVLIIHEVENYLEWKQGFDNAADLRKGAGELEYQAHNKNKNCNSLRSF